MEDESWRRDVESIPIDPDEIKIEQNGRNRRSDLSRKEESIKRDSRREKRESGGEVRQKKEIRDASVCVPDTKESGCQTRESLFQTGPGSSDGEFFIYRMPHGKLLKLICNHF